MGRKPSTQATVSGRNWYQFGTTASGKSYRATLTKMSEPHWFEIRVNGNLWSQTRGKPDAVREFNQIVEKLKKEY